VRVGDSFNEWGGNHRFDPLAAYRLEAITWLKDHSSIPLVNPVRNSRGILCFSILLTALLVSDAFAQNSPSRRRSVRHGEQVARAAWQPVRRGGSPASSQVRAVDHHQVEAVPSPQADPDSSVMEPPVQGDVLQPEPLDGQIMLAPLYDGSVACDALPVGECGCGSLACDGCDAMGSCGGGSCGGSCGGADCSMCGELCSPAAWRPCVTLCLPQDGWVSLEYLGWWQDGMRLPPLVTTSVDPNVSRLDAGVLTDPSTRVLFGGRKVLDDAFNGGRLRFGVWLDRCHTWGVGVEYFQLGSETDGFSATSTGDPILARPFFNTLSGVEDSGLIAYPGVVTGTVTAAARSELTGAGFSFRHLRCCDEGCSRWLFCGCPEHFCSRTEAMFGYRFLELKDSVVVAESTVSTDMGNPGALSMVDRFDTRNQFNGFDIGWMYRRTRGFWTFDTLVRLGVGNTRQTVTINGQTTITDPNDPPTQTYQGGILALTSNIGKYQQNEFTVVPEFNLNVGYQLTDHFRMTLGYTAIYWSNVVRAGDQISRDLNPNLFPPQADPFRGTMRPTFAFDTTDYWVQGINFGGEYRW
jgi:hypothetical protein